MFLARHGSGIRGRMLRSVFRNHYVGVTGHASTERRNGQRHAGEGKEHEQSDEQPLHRRQNAVQDNIIRTLGLRSSRVVRSHPLAASAAERLFW
ncbi:MULTISPECIES: hypothetical protein [Brucella]|jgi:hypothetical protein|uniref:hypothetical protein n=1 Tax=Brucella TaxID=234 RepID=UPI0011CF243D|nr:MULTISPECIES: hypothetical protein [Brucella]